MKVLLLSRYGRLGASSRIRSFQFLPYLEKKGFKITIVPLLNDDYIRFFYANGRKKIGPAIFGYFRRLRDLFSSIKYDLLWVEKELLPWFPPWAEQLLARLKVCYVVDYDDAVFHRYDMHRNKFVRLLLGFKIDRVMDEAALVIVGNPYLAERARRAGAKRVECIPSVVDLERYSPRYESHNSVFTIGWIGSPVTSPQLMLVRKALAEVCKNNEAKLVLVGNGRFQLSGMSAETLAWSEDREVDYIQGFDVGIMPLYDQPWERGKCGYKLVQYMACGKPVVASPVGVNKTLVEHGINGFLASTVADWVSALNTLRNDPMLRACMGREGRKKVEREYCVQVTAPRLATLLLSVAE